MRRVKWLLLVVAALLLLGAVALFAAHRWLGSEQVRTRLDSEVRSALGVPMTIGHLGLSLWPLPALVAQDVELRARRTLSIERVEVRPAWLSLIKGEFALDTVVVRGAVLPQTGVDALVGTLQKLQAHDKESSAPDGALVVRLLPRRTVLDRVTWVDAKGKKLTVSAQARLADDAWPRQMDLHIVAGRLQGAHLRLKRVGSALRWDLVLDVADGTVRGWLALALPAAAGQDFAATGEMAARKVELSRLTAPEPTPPSVAAQALSGRLEADTTFSARAPRAGELLDALQTKSRFTVRGAVLHGLDLAKAVTTAGASRAGTTELDTLTGDVVSRGKRVELRNLVARSGALGATGHVTVAADHRLEGLVKVELAGAVGVPLNVTGTVEQPDVSLTAGAKIGAAVGTVLMPGVGTGAGASVGGKIGEGLRKLFGR